MAELFYSDDTGSLYTGDSVEWLRGLPDGSVDLVFADPPYGLGRVDWDRFPSQGEYVRWTLSWTHEAARVLRSTGSLMVCGFSEVLADLRSPVMEDFQGCRWLVWHYRNKANLSNDWGRSHESILLFRKSKRDFTMNVDDVRVPYGSHTLRYPSHPQSETSRYGNGRGRGDGWVPNPLGAKPRDVIEIPTICNGMGERTPHPTQKPEELLRRLVLGASNVGDLVLDPFSGSGTTAVAAKQLGRRWLACDMSEEYNGWAVDRLTHVVDRTVDEWKEFDRLNDERRRSVR